MSTAVRRAGGTDPASTTVIQRDYKKDSVVQLYNFTTYSYTVSCHPASDPDNTVTVNNTRIENDGYGWLALNPDPKYYVDLPYGNVLPTGGNINAEIISTFERGTDSNGTPTNYHTHGYYRSNEIYDSLLYELCSDPDHPYQAFRPILPAGAPPIDTLLSGPDTLIGHTNDRANDNYAMNGSYNKVWVSVRATDGGTTSLYLQELKLAGAGTKKYAYTINTKDPLGVKLVQEDYTGAPETGLYYSDPEIDGTVYQSGGNDPSTPLLSMQDVYNLGFVHVQAYDNPIAVRVTNNLAILDRNYLITVDNNPNGSGNIPMRFYIPQAQFDALKAVDAAVHTPGDLMVIDQPTTDIYIPYALTPTGNETNLPLTGWGTTDGGYYIEFIAKGFSNFFITRNTAPLPLKWLDVQGKLTSPAEAAITWTVTEEKDVKGYVVQYSPNGVDYVDGSTTASTNSELTTTYSAEVPLPAPGTYFFRVKQEDVDGRVSYSRIVVLSSTGSNRLVVTPNPASAFAVVNIPAGTNVKKLILLSSSGQALWQTEGTLSGAVTIPMDRLPAGVYGLQVLHGRFYSALKLFVGLTDAALTAW